MPRIQFADSAGAVRAVEGRAGWSLMEVAVLHGVPGIDAVCGGSGLCGTCHVYVDSDWLARFPPVSDEESALLESVVEPKANSRLACRLRLSDAHDGLVVHTPACQRSD